MYKSFVKLTLPLLIASTSFAAQPVDLSQENPNYLNKYRKANLTNHGTTNTESMKELKRETDLNQTEHIRVQQTYAGYPILGADAVIHVKKNHSRSVNITTENSANNASMNGTFYNNLSADLSNKPNLEQSQQNALKTAQSLAAKDFHVNASPETTTTDVIIYIDDNDIAHWAVKVNLKFTTLLKELIFIVDASTLTVYKAWDNVKHFTEVKGGGIGGNKTSGQLIYDGAANHLAALTVSLDPVQKLCWLQNKEVVIRDYTKHYATPSYPCINPDKKHNNVYWHEKADSINGGYSPSHDALYAGSTVKQMYKTWYGRNMLSKNNKAMLLAMTVHAPDEPTDKNHANINLWENAVWAYEQIYLGDGSKNFYPLTSLGIIAHEISHGFTEQHSNLIYEGQSGALNESFSDMAAQAAEQFTSQKNTWQIGSEVSKTDGVALRYMDKPSKDCTADTPSGFCSIDHMKDYHKNLNVHFSSGIYNRVFYLIATAKDWDAKKTFGVMLKANADYWTETSTFNQAACGVLQSAEDFKYDTTAIKNAFDTVGISYKKCKKMG